MWIYFVSRVFYMFSVWHYGRHYHILMLRLTHNQHQIKLLYDFMTLFLISEYLNMLKEDANSLFKKIFQIQ